MGIKQDFASGTSRTFGFTDPSHLSALVVMCSTPAAMPILMYLFTSSQRMTTRVRASRFHILSHPPPPPPKKKRCIINAPGLDCRCNVSNCLKSRRTLTIDGPDGNLSRKACEKHRHSAFVRTNRSGCQHSSNDNIVHVFCTHAASLKH